MTSAEDFLPKVWINQKETNKHKIKLTDIVYESEKLNDKELLVKYYIVFSDERHPNAILNRMYKGFRKKWYGSILDLSPVTVVMNTAKKIVTKIMYEDSQDQPYDVGFPVHNFTYRRIKYKNLEFAASTWNHLFLRCNRNTKGYRLIKYGDWIEVSPKNIAEVDEKYKKAQNFDRRFSSFEEFTGKKIKTRVTKPYKSSIPLTKSMASEVQIKYRRNAKVDPLLYAIQTASIKAEETPKRSVGGGSPPMSSDEMEEDKAPSTTFFDEEAVKKQFANLTNNDEIFDITGLFEDESD